MNIYREKYENEKNIKFYPFLNEALQKIMDIIFSDDNTNNIINNSIYGKSFINNNIHNSINFKSQNIINNSLLNESNNNNILLKSLRNNNNSNINETNIEDIINSNNLIHNQSLYNTQRQNQRIFPPSSSPTKTNNNNLNNSFLNKTYSNTFRPRYNINNMQPINEEAELNSDEINISNINLNIPKIPNNIVNNFNIDSVRNYKIINNFLVEESKKLLEEENNYYNKKNANNKLNILKQSGEYSQYNNILDQISRQEDNRANQYLKEIQSKSNIFDIIKKNCEENFKFILNYPDRSNIVSNKLEVLIKHIEDYNKHFNKRRYNNIDELDRNNNIENILNNTFTTEKRHNLYYNNIPNNNESLLNNTINFDKANNRLFNSTSKSSNFNSRFYNTFNHL
jgi:hypothetical protein